jgi:putative hydrolase of the HAD superfamily
VADGEPIDCLILDLDGVVRHWDQEHFAESAATLGLTADELGAIAFEEELLGAAMVGTLTAEAWSEEIGRRAGERHGSDPAIAAAAFLGLGWNLDDDVVSLIQAVRRHGTKVALFSNASTQLEADLASCGLDAEVDLVVSSARIGLAKPDPAAFLEAARILAVDPTRCLFVDDRSDNVEGAREAGMRAETFRGVDDLEALLEQEGLLGAVSPP